MIERRHKCPVCGKHEFKYHNSNGDCPVCGWMDISMDEENPDENGENLFSLNFHRELYEKFGTAYPKPDDLNKYLEEWRKKNR